MIRIEVQQGSDWAEPVTLVDGRGDAVTSFTTAAAVTAEVWPGDDRAPLFSPSVDKSLIATGVVTLSGLGADTAGLEPGDYRVLLRIVAGGRDRRKQVAVLAVLASSGAAAASPQYVSAKQLFDVVPWLRSLQAEDDQAGFAEQRAFARAWLDEAIVAKHSDRAGADGNVWPSSAGWWASTQPGRWMREQLDAGHLVVTPAIRRVVALKAAGEVLRVMVGQRDKTSYQALGEQLAALAGEEAKLLRVEVDTDGDGVGDVPVPMSGLRIRRG